MDYGAANALNADPFVFPIRLVVVRQGHCRAVSAAQDGTGIANVADDEAAAVKNSRDGSAAVIIATDSIDFKVLRVSLLVRVD
jgi:hypothetical protein